MESVSKMRNRAPATIGIAICFQTLIVYTVMNIIAERGCIMSCPDRLQQTTD